MIRFHTFFFMFTFIHIFFPFPFFDLILLSLISLSDEATALRLGCHKEDVDIYKISTNHFRTCLAPRLTEHDTVVVMNYLGDDTQTQGMPMTLRRDGLK
jgi:hypothetical protein